jgi:ubiquinone/menaquinone biosynthesis C-methylase UbiE
MNEESSNDSQATGTGIQPRYPNGYWDKADEYLAGNYILSHNDDYLEFLVSKVWKLDQKCRLVEFGCGYGRIGLKLMALLPAGSTYTGIDPSTMLIAKGCEVWAKKPWQAKFIIGSIYEAPFKDDSFEVTLTHTVLMHVPYPEKALREMIRVTRNAGLVITCEANRNAHTALLHIDEVNHQDTTPLELFQTINREIKKRTGVDHNIGFKMPVLMHRAGLMNVQARMTDNIQVLFPPLDSEYKKTLFRAICDEGYGQPKPDDEGLARWKANLMSYGISEQEAEKEIARELEEDFLNKGQQYHTVYSSLLTWSFGRVEK